MNKGYTRITASLVMALFSAVMLFPFLLMLATSVKPMKEILSPEFMFFPQEFRWSNYLEAMARGNWPRYFFNSVYVTTLAVVISLLINALAGYAFSRLTFRGRNLLFIVTLIGLMIPPQVNMLPVFVILKYIPFAGGNNYLGQHGTGWLNTYMGLLAPYVAGSFGVFLFRQFFLNFPRALDDAAKIDGLGRIGAFFRIYVPLSTPVTACLIALKSTHTWNEYTWPLIIIQSDEMKTVQLALTMFKDETTIEWNLLMAATTLTVIPLVIVFLSVQRYFIEGIVTTGIKG
ncbi:MAG: carbohydrate ABC transporter permease [Spirochaetaceae bacterium]|nr:MAG: carbohydrate ABC transporter permease [Spirochaetaceae bacterium]